MPSDRPVVNEYEGVQSDVERIARQLHAQHQDEPVWDKLHSNRQDDYCLSASRVLACPSVRAAFEAQAKLEALLAGEGDLPEGWTEEWRWSVGVDHGSWRRSREVTVASATACRISGYVVERHLVSPAVRVEEGGES